jgi:hypothetical protein
MVLIGERKEMSDKEERGGQEKVLGRNSCKTQDMHVCKLPIETHQSAQLI